MNAAPTAPVTIGTPKPNGGREWTRPLGRGSSQENAPFAINEPALSSFSPRFAPLVASWVRSDQELLWLAPATPPPLTPQRVLDWGRERRDRCLLWNGRDADPIGYAELNDMPSSRTQFWIGHFLVDPACRGQSWGARFAQALLARAFVERGATDVLLVVFPENAAALRCYERAGIIAVGRERKYFPATGRTHEFIRMGISRRQFARLTAAGRIPADPLPFTPVVS